MQIISMILKQKTNIPIEADSITPDKIFGKNEAEIKAIKVWIGNKQEEIGDLFEVSIEAEESGKKAEGVKIIMKGDLSRVKMIGEGMKGGEIEINSDVDMHCGAMMEGGRITVKGNAECWAGREMKGGELIIEGNAADYFCASYRGETVGMTGGKVVVGGDVGEYAAQYMSGGEIVIKRNAELFAGLNMNGGKITIEGDALLPGGGMINGEIIIKGKVIEMLPSFRYEGTAEIEGEEYKKYVGDLAMGKKAKGVIYVR